jgi:hypothetical protein
MHAFPFINDCEVTHTFRGVDCIILDTDGDLRKVEFTDGRIEVVHRTRLLPIRKIVK